MKITDKMWNKMEEHFASVDNTQLLSDLIECGFDPIACDVKERVSSSKTVSKLVLSIMFYMEKKGITQKHLAELMGVSPAYVTKLLRGNENLTLETISKVENALGEKLISVNEPYKKSNSIVIKAVHFNETPVFDWSNSFRCSVKSNSSALGTVKTA